MKPDLTVVPDDPGERSESWYFARAQHKNLVGYDRIVELMNKPEGTVIRWVLPLHKKPVSQLILSLDKWPKAELLQVSISIRFPATGTDIYYGAIDPEGVLRPSSALRSSDPTQKRVVWEMLQRLRDNPVRVLARLGQVTGKCCMCNRELTDRLSIKLGIGPKCAEKFGISREVTLDMQDFLPKQKGKH